MKIEYTIEFYSYWHCGSGLDAGAEANLLVLKDDNSLPYIPGKTIKGLLKDAFIDIHEVQTDILDMKQIDELFGKEIEKGDDLEEVAKTLPGKAFFSNAILAKKERDEICSNQLSEFLYHNISSTAIDKSTGTAKQHSLRTTEVCIPLELHGYIDSDEILNATLFKKAFQWIRHMGVSRNRGLGRCQFRKK